MNCPKCNNINVIKAGTRKTENRGNVQTWRCNNCGYKFTTDEPYRMRNPNEYISYALDLKNQGFSTRDIQKKILEKFNVNISFVTISRWINEFIENSENFIKKYKIVIEGNNLKLECSIESSKEDILKLFNSLVKKRIIKRKRKT